MALGPDNVIQNFKKECDVFEAQIDVLLQKQTSYKFSILAPEKFTFDHFKELKYRYIKAGWARVAYRESEGDKCGSVYLDFLYQIPVDTDFEK